MILHRFGAILFFVAFTLSAKAQQEHFVYLQTENGQAFYVKLNNKVSSSSSLGYLILPKLSDGDYNLTVGFPKKEFPEENFEISINKKNEGYLLKNFGDKGWGLFDLQSLAIVMGGSINQEITSSKNLQNDPFSKMLADVVNDSSLLQKNEPSKQVSSVEKIDSIPAITESVPGVNPTMIQPDSAVAKTDSISVNVSNVDVVIEKDDTIKALKEKAEPLALLPSKRLLKKKNKEGMEMIYVDRDQNLNDTIRIFIPSEKATNKNDNIDTGLVQMEKTLVPPAPDTVLVAIEQPASKIKSDSELSAFKEKESTIENKDNTLSKENDVKKDPEDNLHDSVVESVSKIETIKKDEIIILPKVVQSSTINSDCRNFASDEDFLKLRKKMASENSPANMIKVAEKSFHSKCFSTEQIKNLSFLFLENAGKYQFFDAAYAFTSDSDQYHTLQSQLSESYYINRFKAMIRK